MVCTAAHPNQQTLHGFLAYLRNERRYSELTAENYARDIRRLFDLANKICDTARPRAKKKT